MTMIDKENIERVKKIDKNTQSTMNIKQLCVLLRQGIEQFWQNLKAADLVDKIKNAYSNNPGLFNIALIAIASVLLPTIIIISIIVFHIIIGIFVFVIFEAIVILSSAAVLSFVILTIIATFIMVGISIIAISVGTQWFVTKLENMRQTFFHDILQY